MRAPLNFEWHILDLLATGGKIDADEKLDYLLSQEFSCFIILEATPKGILKRIQEARVNCAIHPVEEDEDPPIEELSDFIASNVFDGRKTIITCSGGIKRSCQLARAFVANKEEYIVQYISRRVNDLNYGDSSDWYRGHSAFAGDSLNKAIITLHNGLYSCDKDVRFTCATSLIELMKHASSCGCFDGESLLMLRELRLVALITAVRLDSKRAVEYISEVMRFARIVTTRK